MESKFDVQNELLSEFKNNCKEIYDIPKKYFTHYNVKRGLRNPDGTGVMAGITRIGNAHGYIINEGDKCSIEGELYYRGYRVDELINGYVNEGRYGFEEVSYILFFGSLPTPKQLEDYDKLLDTYRELPPRFTEDVIMKTPNRSIMNKLASSVLALYSYDENPDDTSFDNIVRQSMQLMVRLPIIAAQSYAVYRNAFCGESLMIHNPLNNHNTAQNFLRILREDGKFTEEDARLLDLCLILQAEHGGGNNSTFTCRTVTSSGTDTYSAIAAAICSLKGPRHGGANIKVQEMFDCIKANVKNTNDDEEVAKFLKKIANGEEYDHSGLIYGMGHAIYTLSDPRAVMLKKYAQEMAEKRGFGDDFRLLETIERLSPDILREKLGLERDICANVDMYSGLVYRMLGIPTELYTPLFAIARIVGWCSHRIEELMTAKKIIRPAYKAITHHTPYVSMNER
ncbi:MAG: citrate synthase [Ruminococcaceae bacterium]|nr:citrate synthase [Oscillospiraceae bacterium]